MSFFLKSMYTLACNTPSDIYEHLPILNNLANQCNHITEFGTGVGNSSCAFLYSNARVVSYDIRELPEAKLLFTEAKKVKNDVDYIIKSTLDIIDFEPTDLLFIDDLHTYEQLKTELNRYHSAVKNWIVMHDTTLFERVGEDGGTGLWPAIHEFLYYHTEWDLTERYHNNNGLTILKRTS